MTNQHFTYQINNNVFVEYRHQKILVLTRSANSGNYSISYIDRFSSPKYNIIQDVLREYKVSRDDPLYRHIHAGYDNQGVIINYTE